MSVKTVAEYRRMPYGRLAEPVQDSSGPAYFVAFVAEVPWVRIDGSDREEAFLRLDEMFDDAFQAMIDSGEEIPEPLPITHTYGAELLQGSYARETFIAQAKIPTAEQQAPWTAVEESDQLTTV